jgi:hypothetical protein
VVVPLCVILAGIFAIVFISNPLREIEQGLNQVTNRLDFETSPRKRKKCHCYKYSAIWELSSMQKSYDQLQVGLGSFIKFVPVAVVRELLASKAVARLGVKEVTATAFFR